VYKFTFLQLIKNVAEKEVGKKKTDGRREILQNRKYNVGVVQMFMVAGRRF